MVILIPPHATSGHFPIVQAVEILWRRSAIIWNAWGRQSDSSSLMQHCRMRTCCHSQVRPEVVGAEWYLCTRRLAPLQLTREEVCCSRTDSSPGRDGVVVWVMAGHVGGPWKACKGLCESNGAGRLQERPCAGPGTDPNHPVVAELNIFSVELP